MSLVSAVGRKAFRYTGEIVKELRLEPVKPKFLLNTVKPSETKLVQIGTTSTKASETAGNGVLELYNIRKIANSLEKGTGSRIVENYRPSFGLADSNGVFKNAIEHLNASGAIEKFISKRFPDITDPVDIKRIKAILSDYLESNLDIYSYERIESILTKFHSSISEKLKSGAVLYVHDKTKSYGIIADMYKKINPDVECITGWQNLKEFMRKNKDVKIIALDDCLASGKSATDLYNTVLNSAQRSGARVIDFDLYVLCAYQDGLRRIPKGVKIHYEGNPKQFLNNSDYFKTQVDGKDKGLLLGTLGSSDSKFSAYGAVMFPYMSPNNNSLFATHMIKELFSGPECALKNIFIDVKANEKVTESITKMLEKSQKVAA